MSEFLADSAQRIQAAIDQGNPTRLLSILQRGLDIVFKENFREQSGKKKQQQQPMSPFQHFCKRHVGRPDYPVLINAILNQDLPLARVTMHKMSRDGWPEYLGNVSPLDTRAMFRYLAKEDGRRPRGAPYACKSPLTDKEGVLRFTSKEKCHILADHFEEKLKHQIDDIQTPTGLEGPTKVPKELR